MFRNGTDGRTDTKKTKMEQSVRTFHIVVSEIFAGCNFREFRDKGQVCENLFTKIYS